MSRAAVEASGSWKTDRCFGRLETCGLALSRTGEFAFITTANKDAFAHHAKAGDRTRAARCLAKQRRPLRYLAEVYDGQFASHLIAKLEMFIPKKSTERKNVGWEG